MSAYLEDSLKRRIIFFTGKGGVGKSTLSWATALAYRRSFNSRKRILVASWNPLDELAHSPLFKENQIEWLGLNPAECFREYVLLTVKFEKLYDTVFDNHILRTFINAVPGVSESVIAGKLWHLYHEGQYDQILVDMPSSGHAYTFFSSPLGVKKVFGFGFVNSEAGKILDMFQSPEARLDFVSLPEELSITENLQLKAKLESLLTFPFGFLHLNQTAKVFDLPAESEMPGELHPAHRYYLARRERDEEAIAETKKFGLPLLQIPRLLASSPLELVEKIADEMGKA